MNSCAIKYVRRQDSGWKQAAGCSGETSINLSKEIFNFLSYGLVDDGEECCIAFKVFRSDFIEALAFIKTQLPLYRTNSKSFEKINEADPIFSKLESSINSFFKGEEIVNYLVTLYCRKDGRYYLKELKQEGFTIRDFLVEHSSAIKFEINPEGFVLRVLSAVSRDEIL